MVAVGNNLAAFPATFVAAIRNETGITTTVPTAGVPVAVAGALFTQLRNQLPDALSWDPATGMLTVTREQGAGVYDVEVIGGDLIGTNAGAKIIRAAKTPAGGALTPVGGIGRVTEPAAAARSSVGPAYAPGVSLVKGDKVSVVVDVAANGNTVLSRDLTLKLVKVG